MMAPHQHARGAAKAEELDRTIRKLCAAASGAIGARRNKVQFRALSGIALRR
jgi:hypothetical protein